MYICITYIDKISWFVKGTLRYSILLFIFLCWHILLSAQPYTFRNIVMTDGLSGLLVNTIYKDS